MDQHTIRINLRCRKFGFTVTLKTSKTRLLRTIFQIPRHKMIAFHVHSPSAYLQLISFFISVGCNKMTLTNDFEATRFHLEM